MEYSEANRLLLDSSIHTRYDDDENRVSDLELLREELNKVIANRKEIGDRLKCAKRQERSAILDQHREAKEIEYSLHEKIAELQLVAASELGDAVQAKHLSKKLSRFRSRLRHSDWLLWTRSIWKFKEMESNAKTGLHPAQFSSVVPSRLIQLFSFIGDTVLDPFVGTGTTCIQSIKLGRNAIGFDINPDFIRLSKERIEAEEADLLNNKTEVSCKLGIQDARDLSELNDESVQLIITHPPYWNCVKISELNNDLSNCDNESYSMFIEHMERVLRECYRVLQSDRVASFMVGDVTRKVGGVTQLFPLHCDLINAARRVGFIPWDIYIVETKMRNSGGMPMMGSYPYPHKIFAQFAHNYIVVLRKPA